MAIKYSEITEINRGVCHSSEDYNDWNIPPFTTEQAAAASDGVMVYLPTHGYICGGSKDACSTWQTSLNYDARRDANYNLVYRKSSDEVLTYEYRSHDTSDVRASSLTFTDDEFDDNCCIFNQECAASCNYKIQGVWENAQIQTTIRMAMLCQHVVALMRGVVIRAVAP